MEDVSEGDDAAYEYLDNHRVAQLVDSALAELVKTKPPSARMWLASYFAGEPGCDTLLGRLAALEKEVRSLEEMNRSLRSGKTEDSIQSSDMSSENVVPQGKSDKQELWLTPTARIFEEYLKALDPNAKGLGVDTTERVSIDRNCCLLVLDMQKDFMPNTVANPDGGRFAVPEGDQTTSNVTMLMKTFAAGGGTVICSRDYHPHDHCSFVSEGGLFPPHCVQGSAGSEFATPVAKCLKDLMTSPHAEKVMVAFKGFHEDVDSFGALPYKDPYTSKMRNREQEVKKNRDLTGCQGSAWTGAYVMKCSNMKKWDDNPDPNAPPDVLAVKEADKVGLADEVKKFRRVYVAGLALDYGVIDTAISAAEMTNGTIDDVCIILDATRPAYVPGFGTHGSGFLQSPNSLIERMNAKRRRKIRFLPTKAFLKSEDILRLIKQNSTLENMAGREIGGVFPNSLGPFSLRKARVVRGEIRLKTMPTNTTEGEYDLNEAPTLKSLKRFDVVLSGCLSATSPINHFGVERRRVEIPMEAESFCWAYPLKGAHHLTEEQTRVLQCLHNPNFSFPVFGGFVYLSKEGKVVGTNALSLGEGMSFGSPQKWPPDLKKKLVKAGRFQKITFPALEKAGAHWFVWIKPKEIPSHDHGGFGYLFHNILEEEGSAADKDIWYPLRDPTLSTQI